MAEDITGLKADLEKSVNEHSTTVDAFLYNGGTVAILLATTVATLIPGNHANLILLAKILTGFAAFWIALERTLNFGSRWRFHLELKHGYQKVLSKIARYEHSPHDTTTETNNKFYLEIWDEYDALQTKESLIPGISLSAK